MLKRVLIFLLFNLPLVYLSAQDSIQIARIDSLTLNTPVVDLNPKNLLDSLANSANVRLYFFRNEGVSNVIESEKSVESNRDLHLLKAIQLRKKPREAWKFWILLLNLLFLALIRLIHIKRFDEIIQSAFNL
jgi:hypothetical protein